MLLALSFLVVFELRKNQIEEVTKGMEETITKLALEINSNQKTHLLWQRGNRKS